MRRRWLVRLWALVKIVYYSIGFVMGVTVALLAAVVFLVNVGRLFLPRVR
jgi:hypothetical protein